MKWIIIALITIISPFIAVNWNRKKENRQDIKLFTALMFGGFVWSQVQTEYLIWRINTHTDKDVRK